MKEPFKYAIMAVIIAASITLLGEGLIDFDRFKKDDIEFLENELRYWQCKAEIVNEVSLFMNRTPNHNLSPVLVVKYAEKFDVDVRLFLTQGKNESHFGTKGLARKTNSVCNVGAWDEGTITHRYDHPDESIQPYFKLIKENYLVNKTEEDLLENFVDKNGNRYASYQYYEPELKVTWENINRTTKLDSLLAAYRYCKIELNR